MRGGKGREHFQHRFTDDYRRALDLATSVKVVDSTEFDIGTDLAPGAIFQEVMVARKSLSEMGIPIDWLSANQDTLSIPEAHSKLEQIHQTAQVLYEAWLESRQEKNKDRELALARLFNRMTKAGRDIHEQLGANSPFDQQHIQQLGKHIEGELQKSTSSKSVDVLGIAQLANETGDLRTHELAWPWAVLPTFPQQHYGRILLQKVPGFDSSYPGFITQTTFLDGEATQLHTHGQNIAFARPLGQAKNGTNKHINAIWQTQNSDIIFPLRQTDRQYYASDSVAIIPPMAIHSISGSREGHQKTREALSLQDFALMGSQQAIFERASDNRFGEKSCLHIYIPDYYTVQQLSDSPLTQENDTFFMENDMIVFDHKNKLIWAGGGGAWSKRMLMHGKDGDHCGACFTENDPRIEHIKEKQVLDWYVDHDVSKPIVYTAN